MTRSRQDHLRSSSLRQVVALHASEAMTVLFFSVYIAFGGVWTLDDLWPAARGIVWLWLPVGMFLFCTLRNECADVVETIVFSAVGSLGLTTGLSFTCDTIAVWWPLARYAPSLIRGLLFLCACGILTRQAWALRGSWRERIQGRPDWTIIALLVASLCATARYQRAFEAGNTPSQFQFVGFSDLLYFNAMAHELQRGSPPRVCPERAGVPERAYHHLPHLTLALLGQAAGKTELLRLHLVVEYSVIVLILCGLVFCAGRELGGSRAAGLTATWLLFLGAIPTPPLLSKAHLYFYFTIWPQSSSAIEPVLLTSPQMFCGVTIAMGGLLGLLRLLRSIREQKPCLRLSVVVALLTALTLRFRVQSFVVLAPLVGATLLVLAIRYRRWSLYIPIAVLALASVLQMAEMQLSTYLPTSQQVRIGNNQLTLIYTFLHDWPGAAVAWWLVTGFAKYLSPFPNTFAWIWPFVCITMFCLLNLLGIPLGVMLGVFLYEAWRNPRQRAALWVVVAIFVSTVLTSTLLASPYDNYSVGGQIPLHIGWYLLPFGAAGLWRMIEAAIRRVSCLARSAPVWFWGLTFVAVIWQIEREPGLLQAAIRTTGFPVTADEISAWDFCRDELPQSAVVMTGWQRPNTCIWSGFGGRRAYLEYVPALSRFDSMLPPEDSVLERERLIDRVYSSDKPSEVVKLLRSTPATHLVEDGPHSLKTHPGELLGLLWQSPRREVTIWKILR